MVQYQDAVLDRVFSALSDPTRRLVLDSIGREHIFARTGPAIEAAIARMDRTICAACPYRAFQECDELKRQGLLETADRLKEV